MIYRIGLIAVTLLQITGFTAGECGMDPCTGCGGTTSHCCNGKVGYDSGLADEAYPCFIKNVRDPAGCQSDVDAGDPGIDYTPPTIKPPAGSALCVFYKSAATAAADDHGAGCLVCHGNDGNTPAADIAQSCCAFPLLETDEANIAGPLEAGMYLIATRDTGGTDGDEDADATQFKYFLYKLKDDYSGFLARGEDFENFRTAGNSWLSNKCGGTLTTNEPGTDPVGSYLNPAEFNGLVLKNWCSKNIQTIIDNGNNGLGHHGYLYIVDP